MQLDEIEQMIVYSNNDNNNENNFFFSKTIVKCVYGARSDTKK